MRQTTSVFFRRRPFTTKSFFKKHWPPTLDKLRPTYPTFKVTLPPSLEELKQAQHKLLTLTNVLKTSATPSTHNLHQALDNWIDSLVQSTQTATHTVHTTTTATSNAAHKAAQQMSSAMSSHVQSLDTQAATNAAQKLSSQVHSFVSRTMSIQHQHRQVVHSQAQVLGQIVLDNIPTTTRQELLDHATESLMTRLRVREAQAFALEQQEIHHMLHFELQQLKEIIDASLTSSKTLDPFQLAATYDVHERAKLERWNTWRTCLPAATTNVGHDVALGKQLDEHLDFCRAVYEEDVVSMLHELQNNTTKWTLLGGSPSSVPGRPAHALLMDEQHQRLVLAIRGTLTLADALTDIIGTSVPFGGDGGASGGANGGGASGGGASGGGASAGGAVGSNSQVAHSGFVLGSKNVLSNISPILDKTLKEHAIQEVVVVGHSLGAGVASIAAVALAKQYPELVDNQRLTCSAFACPPSMSLALSNTTVKYITSIVHSDDCICSASIHSFVHLFNEIHASDGVSYTIKVADQLLAKLQTGDPRKDWLIDQMKDRLHLDREAGANAAAADVQSGREEEEEEAWTVPHTPPLFPAGRLIHMVREEPDTTPSAAYVAMDATNRSERFGAIHLGETMLSDHSLDMYDNALKECFKTKV